ncbi:hypothetical protein EQH57_0821 [Dictyocoela roeselum]|nr:hypothetical protein EQH57_0821 [Dictyocoela roeselum]
MGRPRKNVDKMRYYELIIYNFKKIRRIQFLQRFGIIPIQMKCNKCRYSMKVEKRPSCSSGYMWRCIKCRNRRSVLDGTILDDCKIDILKFIRLTYLYFYKDIGPKEAIYELKISRTTYYYFKKIFDTACIKDFLINDKKIGGEGKEVQIDETLFNRRKYNKGRKKKPLWIFGGIEVGSGKCFFHEVPDRTAQTLQPLIKLNIEKKTDIVSDMWKSYIGIEDKGYKHWTVNHSKNFVNPKTGKHTQLIENLWMLLKRKLHDDFGINRINVQKYLHLFAWRRNLKRSYSEFLSLISK